MSHLQKLSPMLLDERLLDLEEPGWIYEVKYAGWRLMAEFGDGKCLLRTRRGANATRWFPEIASALAGMKGGPYVTDGEGCVLDDMGRSDFDRFQARALRKGWYEGADPVVYCVFDLLVDKGVDITRLPLVERKKRLAELFAAPPPGVLLVHYFDNAEHDIHRVFHEEVVPFELEGLVAKRLDSVYTPGTRTGDWVKVTRKNAIAAQRVRPAPKSKDISIGP
jgi:bifunctional non-homologous end joining protein LigD